MLGIGFVWYYDGNNNSHFSAGLYMKICLTLEEVLDKCNDWEYFCDEEGWSVWAVNEGGGDVDISLTEEQCYKYGILKREEKW